MWQNKKQLFSLLFEANAAKQLDVLPIRSISAPGLDSFRFCTPVDNPHIRCVVPAGGLALDHSRWTASRSSFPFPAKVVASLCTSCRGVFRASAISAGSRTVCVSDLLPLRPLKYLPPRGPRYGVALTVTGSRISSIVLVRPARLHQTGGAPCP
jgi:hypothetical protein